MSGNKRQIWLVLRLLVQYLMIARTNSSSRSFQVEVSYSKVPLKSAIMANTFQDLSADLSMDGNNATCASSAWVSSRSIDFTLEEPTGIRAISLLMHKYVDVNLEVRVKDFSDKDVLCNTLRLNTAAEREVKVICQQEIHGDTISVTDLRAPNEFFVICEVNAYGAASATAELTGDSNLAKYIGIGCGVGLLVIVVVIVIAFFCRRTSNPRLPPESPSLNTLSMMSSHQVAGGNVMERQRRPIPSPRPVVSRSIPNAYDRPMSLKDSLAIYETIPGDEPPYLILVGEKDIYDDASSSRR